MKKIWCLFTLLVFLIFVTGCSIKRIEYTSYIDTVYDVFSYKTNLHNVSLDGYYYYLPKGASLLEKRQTNSIINYQDMKFYLYVDVISYYHKVNNTFNVSTDSYYSKQIDYDGNFGYLEITKFDDIYFVEFMYNYAKVEALVNEENINDSIYQMSLILSSVKYHDTILESLIGSNTLNYTEEKFDIFKPKKEQSVGDTLEYDYNQVYEEYEGEIKDEDSIEIIEDEER